MLIDFDLDLREHLISGTNRGIYTSGDGGLETKIAGSSDQLKHMLEDMKIKF